jgi:hypothetical protein
MQSRFASLRNKLMVACAFAVAGVLATPAAFAHGNYHEHSGSHDDDVVGALIVGAVIGGVLVSASHHDRYYQGGYYYPAQPYAPVSYYGDYPAYYGSGGYGYPATVGVTYVSGYRGGRGYYHGSPHDHYGYYTSHGHAPSNGGWHDHGHTDGHSQYWH